MISDGGRSSRRPPVFFERMRMTAETRFERLHGFRRDQVTLATWRSSPFNRWAFQNASELVPSAEIAAGDVPPEEPVRDLDGLLSQQVTLGEHGRSEERRVGKEC